MKVCDRCGKSYDNSWKLCLICSAPLSSAGASTEEKILTRLSNLAERLEAVERKLGITPAPVPEPKPAAPSPAAAAAPIVPPAATPGGEGPGELESQIGLVWLNRIGVVALILGAAFFVKYAFDQGWVGPQGRVLIGLIAGAALLFGGERMRRRAGYETVAEGLSAAGMGILYVSVFAAYSFYRLIGPLPAFAALSAVTAYGGWTAVRAGWRSLALLGIGAGFLTPALLGVTQLGAITCFAYLALLNLGILYIALYKDWKGLTLLAFALTQFSFLQYMPMVAGSGGYSMTRAWFSTVFFGIYSLLAVLRHFSKGRQADPPDVALVFANGLFYYWHLHESLSSLMGAYPALLPLWLAALHGVFLRSAWLRKPLDEELAMAYGALSALFVAGAVFVQLKFAWITAAWATEAVALTWMGFRVHRPRLRLWGACLTIVACTDLMGRYFFTAYTPGEPWFWNDRLPAYLSMVAATAALAVLYDRYRDDTTVDEKGVKRVWVVFSNALMLLYLSQLSECYFSHETAQGAQILFGQRQASLSIIWLLYAFGGIVYGMRRRSRTVRLLSLALFGAAILKIFLIDLSQVERVWRILSFVGLGVILMSVSYFYQRYKVKIREFAMKD